MIFDIHHLRMNMIRKLVSIVTPCYNGEKFIKQYAETVLSLNYERLELIFVNDGSSDNTKEKIMHYSKKFLERGILFKYLEKSNGGAASAVQMALDFVEGEYIILYDIDDILFENAISSKVNFLEEHREYGMVRSNGIVIMEDKDGDSGNIFVSNLEEKRNEFIFDSLVFGMTNNWPGSYMIRTEAFIEANHGTNIYLSQYGQNLQMMLPVAYKYRCGFIDEIQMKYIVYKNSHSHSIKGGTENDLRLLLGYIENRKEIIKPLVGDKYEWYCEEIDMHFAQDLCLLGYITRNKIVYVPSFRKLCRSGKLSIKEIIHCLFLFNPALDKIFHNIRG